MRIKPIAGVFCLFSSLLLPEGVANESSRLDTSGLQPSSPNGKSGIAYVQRGLLNQKMGNLNRALADYDEAIRIEPNSVYGHYYRGWLYWALGKPSQAIADLEMVIRQEPREIQAYMILGKVHTEIGQIDRALADYEEAIRRLGSSARDHLIRAKAYDAIGDYRAAASDFQKAKQMASRNDDVLNAIAWFRATCPDGSFRGGRDALQDSTKACELTKWKSRHVIDTVAASYAELGDFENAIKYELQALNMAGVPSHAQKKMQERLHLYKQHKPYREESKLRQARTKSAD